MQDSQGNKAYSVVEEGCDYTQVGNLYDQHGDSVYFENRAYELHGWCDVHGITLKTIEKEDDFDSLWEVAKQSNF